MKIAFILILISVVVFPWVVINLKVSHTVLKLKNAEFSKIKTILMIWLIPFYGAYLAAKQVSVDWGKPKYDDTSGPYGTIGNGTNTE